MPDDDLTKTLLAEYVAIAENLQKGVNVSPETMQRFHGTTGVLDLGPAIGGKTAHLRTDGTNLWFVNVNSVTNALTTN